MINRWQSDVVVPYCWMMRQHIKHLLRMRYDGRDLSIKPWPVQQQFRVGYHYKPTVEEAERGLELLKQYTSQPPREVVYPDCRQISIVS
jgi:predicted DsbA family dithiol-disulfide isomerase